MCSGWRSGGPLGEKRVFAKRGPGLPAAREEDVEAGTRSDLPQVIRNMLEGLPDVLVFCALQHLSPKELANTVGCCRSWRGGGLASRDGVKKVSESLIICA